MPSKHTQEIKFFGAWLASSTPNAAGEYRMRCPIHGDKNASATINFDKGVFHCNKSTCIGGTSIENLKRRLKSGANEQMADVLDISAKRAQKAVESDTEYLSETRVDRYHQNLMEQPNLLSAFLEKRNLKVATVEQFKIGYESKSKRFTIPVRDLTGGVVNIRKYRLENDGSQKMSNQPGMGSPPRLYPISQLSDDGTVFITEGELDALRLVQEGFTAISGTGGAKKWGATWAAAFEGRDVVILYDNDADGRIGARKAQMALLPQAASVTVYTELVDSKGGDVTDYYRDGGTTEGLIEILEGLPTDEPEATEEPGEPGAAVLPIDAKMVSTSVIGTMDSSTNGKALSMTVTVTGRKDPTFSVPAKADASCTLDAGAKCSGCVMMNIHEGEASVEIEQTAIESLARFVESPEASHAELIRKHLGAAKCGQFTAKVTDHHTVQELFVTAPIDSDDDDMTTRRVYTIGDNFRTGTNTISNMVGTTWPNPKDSRNEFYCWGMEEAVTSLDSFQVTDDFIGRMQQFTPSKGQKAIEKAREIAEANSAEVTHIFGRERLHMAMDLVFHSVQSFPFQNGKPIQRGWMEMIVVGATRTGKSETAMALSRHYGAGYLISCENASVAGLIGGATQIGNQWTLQWGSYTLNDRRLAILDEVSGMSTDVVGAMTQVRSSGVAQITKIANDETRARVRSIWISNPRKAMHIDEQKQDGIDILADVIGNPEDIARFDLAMSVREKDVDSKKINRLVKAVEPTYSSTDCRDLVLWAWSRSASDVEWANGSLDYVFEMAEKMGNRYVSAPPLIEIASVKEKIARMSVALAARTFSSDRTGTKVIVQKRHVYDVCNFIDKLYSYENFGYKRRSERIHRNWAIAKKSLPTMRNWLKANPHIADFLIDINGSFRLQDLGEMTGLDMEEVRAINKVLSDTKMVKKVKSQIVMEPILQELLREFE